MPRIPLLVVALFFLNGGVAHFLIPEIFERAMPDYIGYHRELVVISGIFEILGAIGIIIPATRLLAGYGLLALIVAVYPANIDMAMHPDKFPEIPIAFIYLRLPLQFLFFGFVWWAISPEMHRRRGITN